MAGRLSKRAKTHDVFPDVFAEAEDRISQLPNCILICILSLLEMDEAARTSVLSKFWRGLWNFSLRLDFEGSVLLRNREIAQLSKGAQRLKYHSWVNKVLKSNKALALDEFRLHFELFSSAEKTIHSWLSYAFERRVQRLELDFTIRERSSSTKGLRSYNFSRLLDHKEFSEEESVHTVVITDFNFLRSLSLSRVAVTGEVLEFILCKFPFLEHLDVHDSSNLVGINVCGSLALKHLEITHCQSVKSIVVRDTSPALKHLEIIHCQSLESIVMRDTSIVSLIVSWEPVLVLKNNAKLVDVCVCVSHVYELHPRHFICLSGVEVLTLCFSRYHHEEVGAKLIEVSQGPQLTKVKQLVLVVEDVASDGLIHLASLLGLFPNLEKLVLELESISACFKSYEEYGKPSSLPLQHLQAFELYGYSGRASEDNVVMHVVENVADLQRITIELSDLNVKVRYNAKVRADRLKEGIPSSMEVVIV